MNQGEMKMLRMFECSCGEVIIRDKPQQKALCPNCRHYVKTYADFKDEEEYTKFQQLESDLIELQEFDHESVPVDEPVDEVNDVDENNIYEQKFLFKASKSATLVSDLFIDVAKDFNFRHVGITKEFGKNNRSLTVEFKGYEFTADFTKFKATYDKEIVKRALHGRQLNVNTYHLYRDNKGDGRGYLTLVAGKKYLVLQVPYIKEFEEFIAKFKNSRKIQKHRVFTSDPVAESDKRSRYERYAYVIPENQLGFFLNKFIKFKWDDMCKPASDEELAASKQIYHPKKNLDDLELNSEYRVNKIHELIQEFLDTKELTEVLTKVGIHRGKGYGFAKEFIDAKVESVEELIKALAEIGVYLDDIDTKMAEPVVYVRSAYCPPSPWIYKPIAVPDHLTAKEAIEFKTHRFELMDMKEYDKICSNIPKTTIYEDRILEDVIIEVLGLDNKSSLEALINVFKINEARRILGLFKALRKCSSRQKERAILKELRNEERALVNELKQYSRNAVPKRIELGNLLQEQIRYLTFKESTNVYFKEMEDETPASIEDHDLYHFEYKSDFDEEVQQVKIRNSVPTKLEELSYADNRKIMPPVELGNYLRTNVQYKSKTEAIINPFYDDDSALMKEILYFKGQNVLEDDSFKDKRALVVTGARKLNSMVKEFLPAIMYHKFKNYDYIITGGNGDTDTLAERIALKMDIPIIQCSPRNVARINGHQKNILKAGGTLYSFKGAKEKYGGPLDYQLRDELMAQIGARAQGRAFAVAAEVFSGTAITAWYCKEEGLTVDTFASPCLENYHTPRKEVDHLSREELLDIMKDKNPYVYNQMVFNDLMAKKGKTTAAEYIKDPIYPVFRAKQEALKAKEDISNVITHGPGYRKLVNPTLSKNQVLEVGLQKQTLAEAQAEFQANRRRTKRIQHFNMLCNKAMKLKRENPDEYEDFIREYPEVKEEIAKREENIKAFRARRAKNKR